MHRSKMAARPAAILDLKKPSRPQSSAWVQQFFLLALFFTGLMLLHAPHLRLPYFWDEAGYYIAAARDLFLTGTLIPQSTLSNAHPPLVMAWLALAWHIFGYSTLVTRTAMLALSAFSLLGLFRLSRIAANLPVAWATTALAAIYPVFFTQSSLAQVDLPAAGFTFWALAAYLEDRPWKQVHRLLLRRRHGSRGQELPAPTATALYRCRRSGHLGPSVPRPADARTGTRLRARRRPLPG